MGELSVSMADYFRALYRCAGTGHALDDVRVFPSSDALCGAFGARALTVGSDIHFRTGEFAPHTSRGFWLLAHEVAHVVQQRRGPVTALPHSAGLGVGPGDAPEEKEASAAADAALAGRPFSFAPAAGEPVGEPVGEPARPPARLVVQRYMAWEHLILGTAGPEEARNIFAEAAASQSLQAAQSAQSGQAGQASPLREAAHIGQEAPVDRPAHPHPHAHVPHQHAGPPGIAGASVLSAYCALLEDLGRDPENVDAAALAARHPGTPIVTLPGSGLVVTLGELCILPDYLSRPEDMEDAPKSFVLPLIQSTREWNIREMRRAADGAPPRLRDRPRLKQTLAYPSLGGIAELAEGVQVTRLGGRCGFPPWERYQSVVSRNAGHFAPFSWYRWQDHHLQARRLARQARATADPARKAVLTARAWICAGYADHFLQDSFAAGHLINKTLIMQWYAESLVNSRLPVPRRQRLAALTTAAQPGMHGPGHYWPVPDAEDPDRLVPSPTPGAPAVTDPQSMVEATTLRERIAASGVTGRDDAERAYAYASYLTMLRSSVVQSAAGAIHGYFNDNSLVVAAGANGDRCQLWGDWTLLRGVDTGVRAAQAGQLSRQAIEEILAHGQTQISSRRIFALFPDHVEVGGALVSLPEWHSGLLRDQCFGEFFRKPSARVMRAATTIAFPHLGVPSADAHEVRRPGSRREGGKDPGPAGPPAGDRRGDRTAETAGRSAK